MLISTKLLLPFAAVALVAAGCSSNTTEAETNTSAPPEDWSSTRLSTA